MQLMDPSRPDGWMQRIARGGAIACGWWLLLIVAMTVIEIIGRKLFNFSFQAVDEMGAYTLAVASSIGFTLTLLNRGHTRVDFLMSRMPARVQAALNLTAMLLLAALAAFAAWRGFVVLRESMELQSRATTPLQTPLWLPQSLWFAGLLLFAVASFALALHALTLLRRNPGELNTRYGPVTLEEEIRIEAGDLPALDAADAPRQERKHAQ